MASLGHIAIGIAAARVHADGPPTAWSTLVWWSALSLLPDVDVIGFALGVEYADEWGHRGATHSLTLSIVVGVVIGLAARWFGRPVFRTALVASVVLASHAMLDTMTDGGLGCALLWPFDLTRYFAPWRPIPVAPIGIAFFTLTGAMIALIELVLFSPALLFAIRHRIPTLTPPAIGWLLALWLALIWVISSTHPVRDAIIGIFLREDTEYATGYSEAAFRAVALGQPEQQVRTVLGASLGESWFYTASGRPFQSGLDMSAASLTDECLAVGFEQGAVATAMSSQACNERGVREGMSFTDVERVLGEPAEACLRYTWSPGNRNHRIRIVCFVNGVVHTVVRQWKWASVE